MKRAENVMKILKFERNTDLIPADFCSRIFHTSPKWGGSGVFLPPCNNLRNATETRHAPPHTLGGWQTILELAEGYT